MLKPSLLIGDPDLLKQILVKDFDHFTDRRVFNSNNEEDKVMNEALSQKNGEEWRILRSVMTPAFTTGKMRSMFSLIYEKADTLVSYLLRESEKHAFLDMKEKFGRFTMDTIASCAFGIECNSIENDDAEFPKKANAFFTMPLSRMMKFIFVIMFPKLFLVLKIRLNPPETTFFANVARQTIALREKGQKRGDFLDLMLESRDNSENENSKKGMSSESLNYFCVDHSKLADNYHNTLTGQSFSFLTATAAQSKCYYEYNVHLFFTVLHFMMNSSML